MKIKFLFFTLVSSLLLLNSSSAQNEGGATGNTELDRLKMIYESVEYNTIAFDDLKKKWLIDDPEFIREIFNRFVVRNSLRLNGRVVKIDVVKEKSKAIQDGTVTIEVRKRYYDDEIEYFAFIPDDEVGKENARVLFDPVTDGFLLKEILGEKVYDKIRERTYFQKDITKQQFTTKFGYAFDVKLNALESEVMFWNTTSDARNKYLLSLFSKWGNDRMFFPGWFANEMFIGGRMTYFKDLRNNPEDYTYRISAGLGVQSGRPYKVDTKRDQLWLSGSSFYGQIEAYPLGFIGSDFFDDIKATLEVKVTVGENKSADYGLYRTNQIFYSNRNFFNLTWKKSNLLQFEDLGNLEVSLTLSSSDIWKYELNPVAKTVTDLEKNNKPFFKKFNHILSVDVGIAKNSGLIQHNVAMVFGYGSDGYGFFGARGMAMLSGNFGFDVRVYVSAGLNEKKFPYRYDTYLVFSPILRINY
ncbi:MAG: hypothetical protein IAE91_11860 [Ignavibacteriaceae bacterium]|nr:hypothetical protein [Ignavibacteriaceae bacterium]